MATLVEKSIELARHVTQVARSFRSVDDLKPVIDYARTKRVVMLGEASHGTHEFYEWRRLISQELIEKHGFNFIAVEGDFPSSQHVNRYILNLEKMSARDSLSQFHRWPTWMWSNTDVLELVEWLRKRNSSIPDKKRRAGFYGLDVYSLFDSIHAALEELEKYDPNLARNARLRYGCFDPFMEDEMAYVRSLIRYPPGCKEQAVKTLRELLEGRLKNKRQESEEQRELRFSATQNARIVQNAENYYRVMIQGDDDSWNVRDRHMKETLDMLLEEYGPESKGIVWEHNTHIGDYRATDMVKKRQVNIGGLARESYGEDQVALIGFGTYQGTVTASHAWDGPLQTLCVPPGRPGSIESVFHQAAQEMRAHQLYVLFDTSAETGARPVPAMKRNDPLAEVKGHRAIGVVYNPAFERYGNYVPTSLSRRYDAFLFFETSEALKPLVTEFEEKDVPETYPFGQ